MTRPSPSIGCPVGSCLPSTSNVRVSPFVSRTRLTRLTDTFGVLLRKMPTNHFDQSCGCCVMKENKAQSAGIAENDEAFVPG